MNNKAKINELILNKNKEGQGNSKYIVEILCDRQRKKKTNKRREFKQGWREEAGNALPHQRVR